VVRRQRARRGPTGFQLADHIFVGEKGDYYEITDGPPQALGHDSIAR
jgi:hypothetical protein